MKGFGPTKLERYGEDVLAVIAAPDRRGRDALGATHLPPLRPFSKSRPARRSRRIRKLRLLALLTVLGLLGSVSFSFGLIRAIASEIAASSTRSGSSTTRSTATSTTRPGSTVLAVLRGSEARTLVKYEDIADPMRHAIVAIEDRRFWEHDGVDLRGIGRALLADIRQQKVVEGGSTITQQFVKNALDRDQKTIARKVREAAFAWQLERSKDWPKQRILHGVPEHDLLRERRLRRPAGRADLLPPRREGPDDPEAALLAGHPGRPEPLRPGHEPEGRAGAAQRRCCRAMLEEAKITLAQCARRTRRRCPKPDDVRLAGHRGTRRSTSSTTSSSS